MFGYVKKAFGLIFLKQDAYNEVIGDEDAFLPSVIIYILPLFLLGLVLALLIGSADVGPAEPGMEEFAGYIAVAKGLGFSLPFFIPLMYLIGFTLNVGLLHLTSKLFKGEGEFFDLFQVLALPSFLMYFPPISLWYLVVEVVGMKNVYGFSTGKAIVAIVVAFIVVPLVMMIFMGVVLGLLGSMIPAA